MLDVLERILNIGNIDDENIKVLLKLILSRTSKNDESTAII
jgi:hypothetical protein